MNTKVTETNGIERVKTSGFSLLEVVISLGILMALTIAATSMLRSGFDVKDGLSQKSRVIHRLAVAMTKFAQDLQHAYIISSKDLDRNSTGRSTKGLFRLDKGQSDKLYITTRTRQSKLANSYEADTTFVVYETRESRTAPGRKDLYRGETKVVPLDFKDEPEMQLLAKHIKSVKVEPWRGDNWYTQKWDNARSETRDKIPKLVRVTIEAWAFDREEGDGEDGSIDDLTEKLASIVFIPSAIPFDEIKPMLGSVNWEKM
jgi:type II secretory pathway component PulJ